jgi:hypothetical protein
VTANQLERCESATARGPFTKKTPEQVRSREHLEATSGIELDSRLLNALPPTRLAGHEVGPEDLAGAHVHVSYVTR